MLELGHVASKHLFRLTESARVLCFPDRPDAFDKAIERAAPPAVPAASESISYTFD
jgi:hypothetical protein